MNTVRIMANIKVKLEKSILTKYVCVTAIKYKIKYKNFDPTKLLIHDFSTTFDLTLQQ